MTDETLSVSTKNLPESLVEIVKAAYQDKPDKKALAKFAELAEAHPAEVSHFFDLTELTRQELTNKIARQKAARIALGASITQLQTQLGYDQAPMIEKLLIDSIINCWLRYQWTEFQLASFMGQSEVSLTLITWWEKRLTENQKRYLRAVEMLAKVRKMALPALQININTDQGQQINIAGDLVKT